MNFVSHSVHYACLQNIEIFRSNNIEHIYTCTVETLHHYKASKLKIRQV